MVQCNDCVWKPGLNDDGTICPTCKGSGKLSTKNETVPTVPKVKKGKK